MWKISVANPEKFSCFHGNPSEKAVKLMCASKNTFWVITLVINKIQTSDIYQMKAYLKAVYMIINMIQYCSTFVESKLQIVNFFLKNILDSALLVAFSSYF